MDKKQVTIPILAISLLILAYLPIVKAETRLVWSFDWEGMDVEVYAPYQAYPGDTITVRVRVEAKEDLEDVYIRVWLYGSKSEGFETWTKYIIVLYYVDLSKGVVRDQNFDVDIPSDVSPGLIYSHTYCDWKVWRWPSWRDRSLDDSFIVTYLKNKAYEDLQKAYNKLLNDYNALQVKYNKLLNDYNTLLAKYNKLQDDYNALLANTNELQANYTDVVSERDYWKSEYNSLNSTYNTLQSEYNSLKSKHDALSADLSSARNLSYIFIITTIAFIATTAYFATRKPTVKAT